MQSEPFIPYLSHRDDIETLEPGEQESIDGIIKGMTQKSQTVEKRDGHTVRASDDALRDGRQPAGRLWADRLEWPTAIVLSLHNERGTTLSFRSAL